MDLKKDENVENIIQATICKNCHKENPNSYYYCPNCGKQLRQKPLSTSILKQVGIYLIAAFLPPLGLWPGVKYLKGQTSNERIIGIITIMLTLSATLFSLWYTYELFRNFQTMLNTQIKSEVFKNSLNEKLKKQIEDQYNLMK